MFGSAKRWTIRVGALGVAAAALMAATPLWAADENVPTYTGCLGTSGDSAGKLVAVKEGTSPRRTCTDNEKQVRFSSGDITSIAAGTGLRVVNSDDQLGIVDTKGSATLDLGPGYRLPQNCTPDQQVAKGQNGWKCVTPAAGEVILATANGPDVIGNDWSTLGGPLHLSAGDWALSAKVQLESDGTDTEGFGHCRLDATGHTFLDQASETIANQSDVLAEASLSLASALHRNEEFNVAVVCRDYDSRTNWRDLKITATRVPKVTGVQL